MEKQAESLPKFILQITKGESAHYVYRLSCSVVGQKTGFIPAERTFGELGALSEAFRKAHIPESKYAQALSEIEKSDMGSFEIDLNEAQRLSVMHTDTTE